MENQKVYIIIFDEDLLVHDVILKKTDTIKLHNILSKIQHCIMVGKDLYINTKAPDNFYRLSPPYDTFQILTANNDHPEKILSLHILGNIYEFRGCRQNRPLCICKKYDIVKCKWTILPEISQYILLDSLLQICNRFIYLLGIDLESEKYLLLKFDILDQESGWQKIKLKPTFFNITDTAIDSCIKANEFSIIFHSEGNIQILDLNTENTEFSTLCYDNFSLSELDLVSHEPVIYKGKLYNIAKFESELCIYDFKRKSWKVIEAGLY